MTIDNGNRQKILNCLSEVSACMTRIEAERDAMKDIYEKMAKDFEMPKRLSRKLAKIFHKRNFEEEVAQQKELEETYETVVRPT